ncbi:MAG: PhzF family phenazine biosynthesis protein, partial [Pseudomonadota bacterium]
GFDRGGFDRGGFDRGGFDRGGFDLRFHSSREEMDMCGHVVVAVFAALLADGRIGPGAHAARTAAGALPIEVSAAGRVTMRQPPPRFAPPAAGAAETADLIGLAAGEVRDVASAGTALRHLFVEVAGDALSRIRPDDAGLRALCAARGIDTIGVWRLEEAAAGRARARLRDLCHGVGDPEEAASGTTNGALACLLHRTGRAAADGAGRLRVIGVQGVEMGRPSRVETELTVAGDRVAEVRVGGAAELRMVGDYHLRRGPADPEPAP